MKRSLLTWVQATRPQFFTVMILPIVLGTMLAWREYQMFSAVLLGLSLLAGVLLHAATNVLNDYFDHLNQADEFNIDPLTPFAGGSRMIQNQILTPKQTYYFGLILLSIAMLIGLILAWLTDWGLLWIGLVGVLSAYFYSAPPFAFHSRGIGELLVGLNFGILTVLGAYYVQTQSFDTLPIIAAIPLACLVTAILYINEFPDYEADKKAGKNTLVVRLGFPAAQSVYVALIALSFIIVGMGAFTSYFPLATVIVFISLIEAKNAIQVLYQAADKPKQLIPAIKNTIELHFMMSVVLIFSFYLPEGSCFA
ncbi:1,4-dihydroxy-2-naphthoate octaprenyltransferase [Candidatus Albibeggiatoa sp. nov. BB20]|uniref:1,4-dihydroxy-2-naphthoate octaprenyltransferase n=1 Tax=Candidatus Albibeggiatoa sp. nov. BB20 TaxID=3162723 RepID=UPI00336562F3